MHADDDGKIEISEMEQPEMLLCAINNYSFTDMQAANRQIENINKSLQVSAGQLVMLIAESSEHYKKQEGIYQIPCCRRRKSMVIGLIGEEERVCFNEKGALVLCVPQGFASYNMDFGWQGPYANLIKPEEALNMFFAPNCETFGCLHAWSIKEHGIAFRFHLSDGDNFTTNELIIGNNNVNAWLNQGNDVYRGWGYRPLACLMSYFLGRPIELTDKIRKSFTADTIPARNLQIVLNYQLEKLYQCPNIIVLAPEVLDKLFRLLPEEARNSNLGQLQTAGYHGADDVIVD